MSDSDDDYMSDKLLVGCEKSDVRPGLLYNKTQKRTHEIFKKQLDNKSAKRHKSYREQEKETREKGLDTAISSDNVGFRLLEKMGYKAGSSLGKSQEGIKEPVNVVLKESSSGLGREKHIKETIVKKQKLKEMYSKTCEREFRAANLEKSVMWVLRKDYFKAQRICEELDSRNGLPEPVEDYFWTKDTIRKLRKSQTEYESDSEGSDDEPEEEINEEKLCTIIGYLREAHIYCIYCAITGTDKLDLEENCPGPYRRDHDDYD